MTATRPPYQLELDLPMPGRGEAPRVDWQEVEAVTATAERESPAPTEHLMEAICDSDNIETALRANVSSAFDLLVEALQHVGGFEMLVMLPRQPVEGQRFVDVLFDPAGELG